ncbi:MAG: UDP-forming cellulose synthase catalytic subunit [Proteobacteria bacterium]|nr:UDP-forming cellulose synthase catalytic subunit [Pseudomonadota bacterium]
MADTCPGANERIGRLAMACGLLFVVAVSFVPLDFVAQLPVAIALLALAWVARLAAEGRHAEVFRLVVLVVCAAITLRYLAWRASSTLHASSWLAMIAVLLLYAAEIYAAGIHLLGMVVNVAPYRRPLLSLRDLPEDTRLPSVDVLVPSFNEDPALLEVTLRAALLMRYPRHLLRVYLLDDGATEQKLRSDDPAVAQAARVRKAALEALCARVGAGYITRPRNERAKAGNLNHALGLTDGELVAVLDADHVPTVDFLDRTVPWMLRHEDVFLVQTPHFMVNPDPIDRNLLEGFRRMPSENDMFYRTIQRGLDFWGASFFCGSAAILRRRHLDEVGGLAGDTITEDAETAFELHRRGYRSVYVDLPLVAGLAPETLTSFVTQRTRWAQGMTQILLLKRPFFAAGLSFGQRIGYMSSILFWLFPFSRLVFVAAPLAFLLFGLQVYNASVPQILAYALPHVLATYIVSNLLFGRTRWPLISELYEIVQCLFSFVAVCRVLINPRKPSFLVTPKGATMEADFLSPLAMPFYVLFVLTGLAFLGGAYRLVEYPLVRGITTIVLLWNLFNFLTVLAALGVLIERRQRRNVPRMPVLEAGSASLGDGRSLACSIDDVSARGARITVKGIDASRLDVGMRFALSSFSHAAERTLRLPAIVRKVETAAAGVVVGAEFDLSDPRHANDAVMLAYGDSARWLFFQQRRSRPIPFGTALAMMLNLMVKPVKMHVEWYGRRRRARSVAHPAAPELLLGAAHADPAP